MPDQYLQNWAPKYSMLDTAGDFVDAVQGVLDQPDEGPSLKNFVGKISPLPGLSRTLHAGAYGQNNLTTGSGQTLHLTDDALDAASVGVGAAGGAFRASRAALDAIKVPGSAANQFAEKAVNMVKPYTMQEYLEPKIFGGLEAESANLPAYQKATKAAEMLTGDTVGSHTAWGNHADDKLTAAQINNIRKETGWMYDKADKKWKFEIDDSKSKSVLSATHLKEYNEVADAMLTYNQAAHIREMMEKGASEKEIRDFARFLGKDEGKKAIYEAKMAQSIDELRQKAAASQEMLKEDTHHKLSDVFKHDELYSHYPDLKDYDVRVTSALPNEVGGQYTPGGPIKINKALVDNPKQVHKLLLHEIEHAVQDIEGHGGGGSSKNIREESFIPQRLALKEASIAHISSLVRQAMQTQNLNPEDAFSYTVNYIKQKHGEDGLLEATLPFRDNIITYAKKFDKDLLSKMARERLEEAKGLKGLSVEEAFDAYRHLPGEVMSRNVEARWKMTPEQRLAVNPLTHISEGGSLDVKPEDIKQWRRPTYTLGSKP